MKETQDLGISYNLALSNPETQLHQLPVSTQGVLHVPWDQQSRGYKHWILLP